MQEKFWDDDYYTDFVQFYWAGKQTYREEAIRSFKELCDQKAHSLLKKSCF